MYSLTLDDLTMLLVEIEAVINNRPLTYCQDDGDGVISSSDLINVLPMRHTVKLSVHIRP